MSETKAPYTTTGTSGPGPGRAELVGAIAEGVARLASRHRCAVAQQVHHSGISLGHLQILWILQEHGSLPVSRLAAWLGIGVPNATGLLDRMEQRGLVERVRDATDRRVVLARPTDLGRATVAELDGWRLGLVEQLTAPLADAQLGAVLDAIRSALAVPVRSAGDAAGDSAGDSAGNVAGHPAGAPDEVAIAAGEPTPAARR